MPQHSKQHDELFQEADAEWDLERLYEELRLAKDRCSPPGRKKVLTQIEKCHVRGLLLHCHPTDMASRRGVTSLADTLSTTVYRYVQELILTQTGKSVQIRWDNISSQLQEAGFKKKPKESLVVPHSNACYENIPYVGADNFFVGREQEIKKLDELLQGHTQRVIISIFGMPGAGKTELAIQYAKHHLKRLTNSVSGVCWLDARGGNIGDQILRFTRSHNLNPPEHCDQISYCWNNWFAGDWLIVIDDVTDTDYNQQVQPYLPPSSLAFKILLTSRVEIASSIESQKIEELLPEAAEQLLKLLVKDEARIDREIKVAQEICRELGYLPLALELVGRYLYLDSGLSLKTVCSLLKQQRLKLKAIHEIDKHSPMTAKYGVEAAINLTWETLDENTRQLGGLLSLFSLAPIPWIMVESILPGSESLLLDLRANLIRHSLLKFTGNTSYRLHQLIRDFFWTKLEILGTKKDWEELFVMKTSDFVKHLRTPELPCRSVIEVNNSIVPHIEECIQYFEKFNFVEDLFEACLFLGRFHQSTENLDHAEKWYEQCLNISKNFFGKNHSYTAGSLSNLGMLFYKKGCYQDAENHVLQALKIWKHIMKDYPKLFTRDPQQARPLNEIMLLPEVLETLLNLSLIYKTQNQYSKAIRFLRRASKIREALACQNDYFHLSKIYWNLGNILQKQGSYSESEENLEKALQLMELSSTFSSASVEPPVTTSFSISWGEGNFISQTYEFLPQIQQIYENVSTEQIAHIAFIKRDLGMLYYFWENYDKARDHLEEALDIAEHSLIAEHPGIAVIQNYLASAYLRMERYRESEEMYEKALKSYEKAFGVDSPETSIVRGNLEYLRSSPYRDK